jgi:hypothetical protein
MREDRSSPARRLGPMTRRVAVRLAEVACPPEVRTGNLTDGLLAEFEALLAVLPSAVRRSVRGGLVAFDRAR